MESSGQATQRKIDEALKKLLFLKSTHTLRHQRGCAMFNDLNPIDTPCSCGIDSLKRDLDEIIALLTTKE